MLVRHGETEGQSSIRFHGRNDVPLSDLGRAQIRRLVPLLREERFAALVASPLSRARESGELLRAGLRLPPPVFEEEPAFAEVWFGAIEGLSEPEIAAAHPDWYAAWKRGAVHGYPGGETFAGFAARVESGFRAMLARHQAGDLLVVAHRGVIKWGLRYLLGWDEAEAARRGVALGSVTEVSLGGSAELVRWNVLPPEA